MARTRPWGTEAYSEAWAIRYRGCCGCVRLKRACSLVGIFDLVTLAAIFARGLQLYLQLQANPAATAWVVASFLLLSVHLVSIVCLWWGLWRKASLWLLPKIVVKVFTLVLFAGAELAVAYLVAEASSLLVGLVQAETDLGFYAARSAVRVGGTFLLVIGGAFIVLQAWFILILCDCYAYIRRREMAARLAVYLAGKEPLPPSHDLQQLEDQLLETRPPLVHPSPPWREQSLDSDLESRTWRDPSPSWHTTEAGLDARLPPEAGLRYSTSSKRLKTSLDSARGGGGGRLHCTCLAPPTSSSSQDGLVLLSAQEALHHPAESRLKLSIYSQI